MEAIDLNNDGQNDVMDEDIEDHKVLEDSEANRGTQPRQVQSRRRVSRCWKNIFIHLLPQLGFKVSLGLSSLLFMLSALIRLQIRETKLQSWNKVNS
ncbi:hypothetical protein HID58_073378 [Brassica napus]|uniref:Uncharacterized protein n=1 Tax=Brassica napus TaxID=3708 RepID=A0ABQ7Z725_BRANA|nr:hypothetical protein HID58_073378 [Brassica napus]